MRPENKEDISFLKDKITGFAFPPISVPIDTPLTPPDPAILTGSFKCSLKTLGYSQNDDRFAVTQGNKRVCYINYNDSIQSKCKDGTIKSRYLLGPDAKNNIDALANCNNQSQQGKFGGCGIKFKHKWNLLKDSCCVRDIQIYGNYIYGIGIDNKIRFYPKNGGRWKLLFGNDSGRRWHQIIIIDGFIYAIPGTITPNSIKFGILRRKIIL